MNAWPTPTVGDVSAVVEVLESGIWLNGPATRELERVWAERVGSKYCIATSSCTHAIHAALVACDVAYGEEVIVPAYTFVGTVHPILWIGAKPRFVDCDPESGVMDPELALTASKIGRTRAAIVVHIHGDVWPWTHELAHNISPQSVIEDACQAHDATWIGRKAGTLGKAGTFSLNAVKNLPAGQGGLLVTDDDDVAQLARAFCGYGHQDDGVYSSVGHSYPITEVAAALALSRLETLAALTDRARAHASCIAWGLRDVVGVPYSGGVAHKVPLVFRDAARAKLALTRLREAGVPVTRWQTLPVACHPAYGHKLGEFPGAVSFVQRHVMLGDELHPVIAQDQQTIDEWLEVARPIIEEVQS